MPTSDGPVRSRPGIGRAGRAALCAALLALAACAPPVPSVTVAEGTITIAGPEGYCVAPGLGQSGAVDPVVVLRVCGANTPFGIGASDSVVPALLTATVSAGADTVPAPEALEAFLRSEAGRAAISRSGAAETVSILSSRRSGGALLLYIRDTSVADGDGTQAPYWRAILGVKGHLVTATVRGFSDRPLSRDDGLRLATGFVAALVAANVAPPAGPLP